MGEVISDLGRQMQRMEDDLGSFVFLYTSILAALYFYILLYSLEIR